jgi:serine/threonine-protein kinase
VIKGKVAYMSPEQAVGASLDARADVFAVGVTLWESVVGRRMWDGVDERMILRKLMAGDLPMSAREANPDVPEELDRICRRALSVDLGTRYPTASAMQSDLEAYLSESGGRPSPRDIGKVVADLFADRRAQLKTIVDAKLAELKDLPPQKFTTARIDQGTGSVSSMNAVKQRGATEATDPGVDATRKVITGFTGETSTALPSKPGVSKLRLVAVFGAVAAIVATLTIIATRGPRAAADRTANARTSGAVTTAAASSDSSPGPSAPPRASAPAPASSSASAVHTRPPSR